MRVFDHVFKRGHQPGAVTAHQCPQNKALPLGLYCLKSYSMSPYLKSLNDAYSDGSDFKNQHM